MEGDLWGGLYLQDDELDEWVVGQDGDGDEFGLFENEFGYNTPSAPVDDFARIFENVLGGGRGGDGVDSNSNGVGGGSGTAVGLTLNTTSTTHIDSNGPNLPSTIHHTSTTTTTTTSLQICPETPRPDQILSPVQMITGGDDALGDIDVNGVNNQSYDNDNNNNNNQNGQNGQNPNNQIGSNIDQNGPNIRSTQQYPETDLIMTNSPSFNSTLPPQQRQDLHQPLMNNRFNHNPPTLISPPPQQSPIFTKTLDFLNSCHDGIFDSIFPSLQYVDVTMCPKLTNQHIQHLVTCNNSLSGIWTRNSIQENVVTMAQGSNNDNNNKNNNNNTSNINNNPTPQPSQPTTTRLPPLIIVGFEPNLAPHPMGFQISQTLCPNFTPTTRCDELQGSYIIAPAYKIISPPASVQVAVGGSGAGDKKKQHKDQLQQTTTTTHTYLAPTLMKYNTGSTYPTPTLYSNNNMSLTGPLFGHPLSSSSSSPTSLQPTTTTTTTMTIPPLHIAVPVSSQYLLLQDRYQINLYAYLTSYSYENLNYKHISRILDQIIVNKRGDTVDYDHKPHHGDSNSSSDDQTRMAGYTTSTMATTTSHPHQKPAIDAIALGLIPHQLTQMDSYSRALLSQNNITGGVNGVGGGCGDVIDTSSSTKTTTHHPSSSSSSSLLFNIYTGQCYDQEVGDLLESIGIRD
jgi:hypothetical protein